MWRKTVKRIVQNFLVFLCLALKPKQNCHIGVSSYPESVGFVGREAVGKYVCFKFEIWRLLLNAVAMEYQAELFIFLKYTHPPV